MAKCLEHFNECIEAKELLNPEINKMFRKKYALSLSHSDDYAIAVASSIDQQKYLGVDIENINRPTKNGFKERISSIKEINELRSLGYREEQLSIVIFSIKEACYKATSKIISNFSYSNYCLSYRKNQIRCEVLNSKEETLELNCTINKFENQLISIAYSN